MEREKILRDRNVIYFLIVIFTVGAIGHSVEILYPYMLLLTPFTLFLTNALVLFKSLEGAGRNLKVWFPIVYLVTFALEVIGVKTGLVFGEYIYGETLGAKLFEVPIIIGFNWVMVILGAIHLSRKYVKNIFAAAIIASLMAVSFDVLLEPIAIKIDYWNWDLGYVPLQNYAAWFLIALFAALLYNALKIKKENYIAGIYFIIQVVFFAVLNLTL